MIVDVLINGYCGVDIRRATAFPQLDDYIVPRERRAFSHPKLTQVLF